MPPKKKAPAKKAVKKKVRPPKPVSKPQPVSKPKKVQPVLKAVDLGAPPPIGSFARPQEKRVQFSDDMLGLIQSYLHSSPEGKTLQQISVHLQQAGGAIRKLIGQLQHKGLVLIEHSTLANGEPVCVYHAKK